MSLLNPSLSQIAVPEIPSIVPRPFFAVSELELVGKDMIKEALTHVPYLRSSELCQNPGCPGLDHISRVGFGEAGQAGIV